MRRDKETKINMKWNILFSPVSLPEVQYEFIEYL